MYSDFQQFVPSSVCLNCDGCCRFKEPGSEWRPKLTHEERRQLAHNPLASEIFSRHADDELLSVPARQIGTSPCECSLFDAGRNACRIYGEHPFDCQLYPFVLVKNESRVGVYVHQLCPHVQTYRQQTVFAEYVGFLQNYFQRPEVTSMLAANPHLAGEYRSYLSELEFLFFLS